MIEYNLDTEHSILHVQPKSAIEPDDFVKIAKAVDPHIEATGGLAGVIIEASGFPGWKSFGAMVNQFRFVRDHHKRVKRIGVVTDSRLGDVAEHVTSHFVSAEIKHFPLGRSRQQDNGSSTARDALIPSRWESRSAAIRSLALGLAT